MVMLSSASRIFFAIPAHLPFQAAPSRRRDSRGHHRLVRLEEPPGAIARAESSRQNSLSDLRGWPGRLPPGLALRRLEGLHARAEETRLHFAKAQNQALIAVPP